MFLHNMSQLKQRLTISFFSIAILLFSITFSHNPLFKPIFVLLTAAVIAFAQWEYYHIAQRKGLTPLITLGVLASLLYLFSNFLVIENANLEPLPFMVLWLTLIATFLYYFSKGANPYSNIATTLFGIVYLTIPLSLLLNITYFFPEGATQDGRL